MVDDEYAYDDEGGIVRAHLLISPHGICPRRLTGRSRKKVERRKVRRRMKMRSLKVLTRSKEAEDPQKEAADPIPRSLRRALIRTHRRDRIFCQHLRGEKPEKGKSPRGKTEEQPRLSKDRGVLWRQEQVSEVEACSPGAAATLQAGGGRVGNVDILVNEEGCKGLPGTTHCE